MSINRHNYEEKLIDFLDGKLSKVEQDALFLFLDANPGIKEEFESLREEMPTVASPDAVSFPLKETLVKKPVGDTFVDEFSWLCISRLEGDASPADLARLARIVEENPTLSAEQVLFEKTKLHPSEGVTFAEKSRLTRHRVGSSLLFQRYAVAASIAALMVLVTFPVGNEPVSKQHTVAYNRQPSAEMIKPTAIEPSANRVVAASVGQSAFSQTGVVVAEGDSVSAPEEPLAHDQVAFADNAGQQLAAITPIAPEVSIISGVDAVVSNPSLNREPIKTMDPTENPSRYLSVGEFLAEKVVEKCGVDPSFVKSTPKAKFWQIAQVGIKGASRLLGLPVKIEKEYDDAGNLKKISIDSKLLALSRNL